MSGISFGSVSVISGSGSGSVGVEGRLQGEENRYVLCICNHIFSYTIVNTRGYTLHYPRLSQDWS